jgi:hypothetical protein
MAGKDKKREREKKREKESISREWRACIGEAGCLM